MSFSSSVSDDTLAGAAAIAAYIGKTTRQTQHLLEMKQLPAFKLGNIWHMRKSRYIAFIAEREAAAAA